MNGDSSKREGSLPEDPDPKAQRERRDKAMRAVGAYSAIHTILRDLQLPEDRALERLHDDLTRWANKASLRAWELGDD